MNRFLLVLFSDYPAVEKIDIIGELYPNWWIWSGSLIVGPSVSCFAYVLGMPRLLLWIDRNRMDSIKRRKNETLATELEFANDRLRLLKVRRQEQALKLDEGEMNNREAAVRQLENEKARLDAERLAFDGRVDDWEDERRRQEHEIEKRSEAVTMRENKIKR